MTPKDKVQELINKFIKPTIKWDPINGVGYYNDIIAAKECALIAVDEQIKLYNEMNQLGLLKDNSIGLELLEVKQEINKL
jgi:hypothetical protein